MFFKIITGYGAESYVEITKEELQKAIYCFLEKKDSVFSGGIVKGAQIIDIKPDFHRVMGWNRGYKLAPEDFQELAEKGIDRKTQLFFSKTQEVVKGLIASGKLELLGKVEVDTKSQPRALSGGMRQIGDIARDQNDKS